MPDVADELGVGYPGDAVRAEQDADSHVGDQQRLTGKQRHGREHGSAGENQEERFDDAYFHGAAHLP